MKTLNIIGCGRLGRTLAKLWSDNNSLTIGGICNRTLSSSESAQKFIQSGAAIPTIQQLPKAQFWLIAVADDDIEQIVNELATHSALARGDIVFHCSGSKSASVLEPLVNHGALTASVHPIHSFADPQRSQQNFAGTYCAVEGDSEALQALTELFQSIGGNTFTLGASSPDSDTKALYHAATAVASNYLVTLLDGALKMLQHAGVERSQARDLLGPIVRQTADNVRRHDCVNALTGPIARGDSNTIDRHINALKQHTPSLTALYKLLGQHTVPLAAQQGSAKDEQLQEVLNILTGQQK